MILKKLVGSHKKWSFRLILKATDFYHKWSIIDRKRLFSNENSIKKLFYEKNLSKILDT